MYYYSVWTIIHTIIYVLCFIACFQCIVIYFVILQKLYILINIFIYKWIVSQCWLGLMYLHSYMYFLYMYVNHVTLCGLIKLLINHTWLYIPRNLCQDLYFYIPMDLYQDLYFYIPRNICSGLYFYIPRNLCSDLYFYIPRNLCPDLYFYIEFISGLIFLYSKEYMPTKNLIPKLALEFL